jgi:hypothetical protein
MSNWRADANCFSSDVRSSATNSRKKHKPSKQTSGELTAE